MKIDVTLAEREVGTRAVVTERKWFRVKVTNYVCVSQTSMGGGEWANVDTDESVGLDMCIALNAAAQAAAVRKVWKGT